MPERPPHPDSAGDAGTAPGREAPARTPRWVMAFGVLTLLVALLFVILMLAGGNHGPGQHFRSRTPGSRTAPRVDQR
jgi:hypothetical protein